MAHKFNRDKVDPYSEAAHQIEENMDSGEDSIDADSQTQAFDTLSNAVVTAIGDVAATAFRLGINDPGRLEGLAEAVANSAKPVILAYQGEVDPEPAFAAIESDPRLGDLVPEQRDRLTREVAKTRHLEELLPTTRRLPDLLDLAGQVGLHVPAEVAEAGEVVMTTHPTSTTQAG
jgi:hypothetical protein